MANENTRNLATRTTAERMAGLLNEFYAKKSDLTQLNTDAQNAIKSATYANNKLSLFRTADSTGTAAYEFDLPEELFLDQNKTAFVGSFAWKEADYPGSTNPNLEGKPVMVLAVKGDGDSVTYSFLNMEKLTDTYSAKAGDGSATVTVAGYEISVNVNLSDDPDNIISKDASGKLVAKHQSIAGKADKVSGDETNGKLAGLDANGNLTNSGVAAADVVVKITSPTADNLVVQDASGKIADSGIAKGDVVVASDISDYTEAELRTLLGLPAADAQG